MGECDRVNLHSMRLPSGTFQPQQSTGDARLIKCSLGETEQAAFYEGVRTRASAERVTTFILEAFEENWKGGDNPNDVEKHWGLYRADRTRKAAAL